MRKSGNNAAAPTQSRAALIEELLTASETLAVTDAVPEWQRIVSKMETDCDRIEGQYSSVKCRLGVGYFYEAGMFYRSALRSFDLARDIQPQLADPYAARGNIYYALALFDSARRRRFHINGLLCKIDVDDRTRSILSAARIEYTEALHYHSYNDVVRDKVRLMPMNVVAYRRTQLNDVDAGSSTITLHKIELAQFSIMLRRVFPHDSAATNAAIALKKQLMADIAAHPNQFPGVPDGVVQKAQRDHPP